MRRRALVAGAVLVLAAAGAAWMFREPMILGWLGSGVAKTTLAEREARLEPALHVYMPAAGSPPYPVVLQFHGCGGYKPAFQEQWARAATDKGFMAIGVDSYAPRGITRERALKSVCNGKELIGQERAGDVAAALEIVRKRSDVDLSRFVLAGWSHGAWTVMDYLALTGARNHIPGLADARASRPPIAGVFLVYPHCGLGAWTRLRDWGAAPPTLALIAGADTIVDPKACPPLFARLKAHGATIDAHVYPKADHAFDDDWLPEGWTHMFDAAVRDDAVARYQSFLDSID
ncbi:MAG: dienelactone hydrolase family protein [Parvularculaceae bacterium]|nr:dienelactone hydrolase family protein [Parvularculaceae bacterium]